MSIDFQCPECSKLLRVPDGSEGRQAQCPHCGQVANVPGSELPEISSGFSPDPFASSSAGTRPAFDPDNPYAAPHTESDAPPVRVGLEQLQRRTITLDMLVSRTWATMQDQLGNSALLGLLLIGMAIVSQVVGIPLSLAQPPVARDPIAFVGFFVAQQVWGQVIGALLMCVALYVGLALARRSSAPFAGLGDAFSSYLRLLGYSLLVGLLTIVIIAACAIPFAAIGAFGGRDMLPVGIGVSLLLAIPVYIVLMAYVLSWVLAPLFIIDHNMGVVDAMTTSRQFMIGNRLSLLATGIVVGIVGMVFVLVTCGLGLILLYPFGFLIMVVAYLSATGQWEKAA